VTLPIWTTNPNTSLSTTQIQSEFGGDAPTNLSEYYRNGSAGYVTGDRVGFPNGVSTLIPVLGNPLSISNFYGASAVGYAITTNKPSYDEGETMTISVTAPATNGTTLYWTIEDSTTTITISPTTLSAGVKGGAQLEPVSQVLTASGGTAPYTFSIVVGSLPAGVTLSSAGLLSGFPTSAGVTTFTVQALDSQGNGGVRQYSLSVGNAGYAPLTLTSGTQGVAYSQQLSVTGGTAPLVYTALGNLPAGLSISSSGLISGTPTVNGTFNASFRVGFNGGGAGNSGITISYTNWTINVQSYGASTIGPSPLPVGYSGQSYSQQLTFTGDVVAPVVFEHAATPGQTHSGNGAPYVNPLPDGVSLSSTGLLSGTIGPNWFGSYSLLVKATDSRQNSVTSQITWPVIRITTGYILPSSLPAGTRNTAYTQQLSVNRNDGNTYRFASTSGLPTGLSLTSGGLLSGTPTVNGTFSVGVVAGYDPGDNDPSNDYDRYTATYSLVINAPAVITISISPSSLPSATRNIAFSQQLSASGGTGIYTYSKTGSLPNGITLNSSGLLAGTPTVTGTFSIDVTATDSNSNTGSKTYSLVVGSVTISISPSSLSAATQNSAFSQQLSASGGTAPYTYSNTGSLPSGLSLTSGGLISGTPTATGTYSIDITATDANNNTGSASYSLVVGAAAAPASTLRLYVASGAGGSSVYETNNPAYIDIQIYNEYPVGHVFNTGDYDRASWQISSPNNVITPNDFTSMTLWSGATPDNDSVTINPITSLSGTIDLKYFAGGSGRNMLGVITLYVRADGISEGIEEFTFTVTVNGQTANETIYIRD